MKKKEGWIALDIDGTITLDKYSVPEAVTKYLRDLTKRGWRIAMATGRPFSFAKRALSSFDFPYAFLPQNGSLGLDMPGERLLFKRYIPVAHLPLVESAFEGMEGDFILYSGYEKGDFCYYRSARFDAEDLRYLSNLQERQKEEWKSVQRWSECPQNQFPLIKCFGNEARMRLVAERLRKTKLFEVSTIRDPFQEGTYILLITDRTASKGLSLTELFRLQGRGGKVIAAGDDENDLSMLQIADVKIAMAHAPESLQEVATFIAPPTRDCGIIHALELALRE